eukprot:482077_1
MTALADKTSEKNVTSLTSVHKCGVCGISGKLLRCSGCNTVWYCSKEHQLSDWKLRHKRQCTRLDKKIKMEKEKKEIIRKSNTENTEYDFIFVTERALKNQLNAMYSQNVDFSKCGDMQFINTGGINPILQ